MTDPGQALDRVLALTILLGGDMDEGLGALGLTPARAHVVWVLREHGPSTQRDLAERLEVTPRNVTGLVDGLVATGFVTREPHPSDRRATLVTLTPKGIAATETLTAQHQEFARELFAGMPPDRYEAFVAGLDDVVARIEELRSAAGRS